MSGGDKPTGIGPNPEAWQRVKAILTEALALAPEARAAFVDAAARDDPAVADEVRSLLAVSDTAGEERAADVPGAAVAFGALVDALARHAPPDGATPSDPARAAGDAALDALWGALADRYTVVRPLGRGGMATVHLARDRRHDRDVAIKVLHPHLATVVGRERFLREIAVTAALRHPHILPLFDSGSAAGQLYFVMPCIDGETLRARLARDGVLPIDEALAIAAEIAGALAHAHARGIVHRDIKPENVLLERSDGAGTRPRALVTDFGIARALEPDADSLLTRTGFVLGTPRYMAPEQARGDRTVDARADVYALGAVLHELLVGDPPFPGRTLRRLAARADSEPAPSVLARRPEVPLPIAQALMVALAPRPDDRFADAAAFAAALVLARQVVEPRDAPTSRAARPTSTTAATSSTTDATRRWGALRVAVLLAVGAGGGWQGARLLERLGMWSAAPAAVGAPTSAAPTGTPATRTFVADAELLDEAFPVLTPDGRAMILRYVGPAGDALHVRPLATERGESGVTVDDPLVPRAIAGTERASHPFVAPDGRWVGFVRDGALERVPRDGGVASRLATLPAGMTVGTVIATDDGELVVTDAARGTLWRLPRGGESLVKVAVDGGVRVGDPAPVTGRRAVLATIGDADEARVALVGLDDGRVQPLAGGRSPRLVGDRLLWITREGTLRRQAVDPSRGVLLGEPATLASGVAWRDGRAALASAADMVLYRAVTPGDLAAPPREALRLTVVDRSGRRVASIDARVPWTPRFSPDGRTIAYGAAAEGDAASELRTTRLGSGATRRRPDAGGDANDPQWSPDGRSVAWSVAGPGGKRVVVAPVGGGAPRPLAYDGGSVFPTGWTPRGDGVVATVDRDGDQDVVVLPFDGGPARPVIATPASERGGRISPDGRWIAWQTSVGGRAVIEVAGYPRGDRRVRISPGTGVHPVWRGDGRELLYWEGSRLVAVATTVDATGTLRIGAPSVLLGAPYPDTWFAMYDVSPDGARIVLAAGAPVPARLVLLSVPPP